MGGCATTRELPTTVAPPRGKGVNHKVHKGETIWRIAQAYNVSIDEIIKSNNIPNVAKVEENQLVFIPGADTVKTIEVEEDSYKKEFIWPLKGKVISYFGDRQGTQLNKGITIQASPGDVVCATREGRVIFADALVGSGQMVVIDHEDGFLSVYSQNASLLVAYNDHVEKGMPVARVGKIGNLVSLHFEIRKHSVAENPLYYLP